MWNRQQPLARQVMVITGGSSGIGLATVRMAAEGGAKVIFAARNAEVLRRIESELRERGYDATHVVADVGRREDVERIAKTAIDTYGRIDTWVNDAGVDIWGKVLEVADEDNRRLFDTNLWGLVYGCQVAVEAMRMSGGTIVNVGSIASDRAFPLQGMYCASKHAVKAFTDAMRMELEAEDAPIAVTLIKPAGIGTPLPTQAKNYLDREPKLPGPLYAPDEVARAILHAAAHPVRDIYVGGAGKLLTAFGTFFPRLTDLTGQRFLFAAQLTDRPSRRRRDNLHEAGDHEGMERHDPEGRPIRPSYSTRMDISPWTSVAMVTLAGIGAAAIIAAIVSHRRDESAADRLMRRADRWAHRTKGVAHHAMDQAQAYLPDRRSAGNRWW